MRLTRPRPRGTPNGLAHPGFATGNPSSRETPPRIWSKRARSSTPSPSSSSRHRGWRRQGEHSGGGGDAATAPLRRLERHAIAAATRVQSPRGTAATHTRAPHQRGHARRRGGARGGGAPGRTRSVPRVNARRRRRQAGELAPTDSPAGILAAKEGEKPARLAARRMSAPRRPGSARRVCLAAGRVASIGAFTLGLDGADIALREGDPPSRFATPTPASVGGKRTTSTPKSASKTPKGKRKAAALSRTGR